MPKSKFEVIIYWSEEDQAFVAEVPELPGCAADGETHREALQAWRGSFKNGSKMPVLLAVLFPSRRAGWSLREMRIQIAHCDSIVKGRFCLHPTGEPLRF
jgi:hypothetical protein